MLYSPLHWRLCTLLLVLPVALPVPTQGFSIFGTSKKDNFASAPPLPAPVAIVVDRKQTILIPLRVIGPQPESVKFLLRTLPAHGTATLLTPPSGVEGLVEYRPPEDRTITSDSFGFAAANSNGFSSEAPVTIRITDRAGRIELPARLDFPKAKVGFVSQQTLHLKNTGDAPVRGTISAPPEWIATPDTYEIKPQEELLLQLSLLPLAAGGVQGDLFFSHISKQPVQLHAIVSEWIQAAPDPVKLVAVPGTKQRKGLLRLRNDSPSTETVRLESEPALVHPAEITLQPEESREVVLGSTNLQSEPFAGTLRLTRSDATNTHRVLLWGAEAIGPILRIVTDLSTPTLVPDDTGRFTPISLQNEGGLEGLWSLQTTPPFSSNSKTVRLLPGKSGDVHVSITTLLQERTEGVLKIHGAGQTFEIALVATPAPRQNPLLPAPRPSAGLAQRPTSRTTGSSASASSASPASAASSTPLELNRPASPFAQTADNAPVDPELRRITQRAYLPGLAVKGSQLRNITAHSAVLDFPATPEIATESLLVEGMIVNIDPNNNLVVQWDALPGVKARKLPNHHIEFTLSNLAPATTYTIRVVGSGVKNGRRAALHQCDITTLEASGWWSVPKVCTLLGLVLAAFGFRAWRIRRIRGW